MKFRKLDYLGIHQGQGDNCKFVFCYNVQQYVLLRRMFLSIRFENTNIQTLRVECFENLQTRSLMFDCTAERLKVRPHICDFETFG